MSPILWKEQRRRREGGAINRIQRIKRADGETHQ